MALLAVTLMNENTHFDLRLHAGVNKYSKGRKKGQPLPPDWWDYGPFQLNDHYTTAAIDSGIIKNDASDLKNFLSYGDIYGKTGSPTKPFDGSPLANGRMAARVLNTAGGNSDRQKAINYAQRAGRGDDYDFFGPLFNSFFECYHR